MKTKILPSIFIVLSSLIILACSKESAIEQEEEIFKIQGENGFVATLDSTDAFIALLIADEESVVFTCNGDEGILEWFEDSISDPTNISLTNSSGARVSGKFTGDSFDGEVNFADGSTHFFSAIPNADSIAGIFRVYGDEAIRDQVRGGWILNSSGEERGSIRVRSENQEVSFGQITDGASNTIIFIEQKFYPVGHWFLKRSQGTTSIVAPNN